jgi:hypothetical protein
MPSDPSGSRRSDQPAPPESAGPASLPASLGPASLPPSPPDDPPPSPIWHSLTGSVGAAGILSQICPAEHSAAVVQS